MRVRHRIAWGLGVSVSLCVAAAVDAQTAVDGHQPSALNLRHRGVQAEGPPLTLAAAVDEAPQRNPELIALRHAFEAAKHRPAQERWLDAPTFEAQIWQWPINSVNPASTNMYMFTATQALPGSGKRALRAAVAEKDVEIAQNEIGVRARAVIDEVKRTYAELLVARKAIDTHLASVDLLRQFADVSAVKYETGRISQQDVLKAIVEISKLHEDLVMLDERAGIAEAELAFVKKAQALGFSLDEIKHVLDLGRLGQPPCSTVLNLARSHLAELDRRIEQLQRLRDQLGAAVRRWQSGGAPPDCASTLCGLITDAIDDVRPQSANVSFSPEREKRDRNAFRRSPRQVEPHSGDRT